MESNPTVWRKAEKQSNPKVVKFIRRKVDVKTFLVYVVLTSTFLLINFITSGILVCLFFFVFTPHTHTHTHTHIHIYIYIYIYIYDPRRKSKGWKYPILVDFFLFNK